MTPCTETAFLTAQLIFFAGVTALYLAILIRTGFKFWRSLKIMIGWGDESRTKLENALALVIFAISLAAMAWVIRGC